MSDKILKIGKKEIDYSWISVDRTIRAMNIYNNILVLEDKTDENIINTIIDAVVVMIHIDFNCTFEWLRRKLITKKYILKHLNYTELTEFTEIALDPILKDKKKAIKGMHQIEEIAEKLLEKMSADQLAELLQKQLASTDGQSST